MLHTIQIVMRLIYNFLTLKELGNNCQLSLHERKMLREKCRGKAFIKDTHL